MCHRWGIDRLLVERLEAELLQQGASINRFSAIHYAVPFYPALGYECFTGVRNGWAIEGHGLIAQPKRKVLVP